MTHDSAPLLYATTELNGITFRPSSRELMKQAVAGRRIDVLSGDDYINLYHVFERMQATDKRLAKYEMLRKQVGESRWAIFIVSIGKPAPNVDLDRGYDPKRGRYKRFAGQLAAGMTLSFQDKAEAIKARRAWQLYVSQRKRKRLKSRILKRGGNFLVEVVDRE